MTVYKALMLTFGLVVISIFKLTAKKITAPLARFAVIFDENLS